MDSFEKIRSNYFLVSDPEAFTQWAKTLPASVVTTKIEGKEWFSLVFDEAYDDTRVDETSGELKDVDLMEELSGFLEPGQVAIVMRIYYEGFFRYLGGVAAAVNSEGERVEVYLDDIYAKASRLGNPPTRVEN